MKIIAKTRSGKPVDVDLPTRLIDITNEFTIDDHYDAACVWSAYGSESWHFRKKEYHGLKAGLTFRDMVRNYYEMNKLGAFLIRTYEKGLTDAKR